MILLYGILAVIIMHCVNHNYKMRDTNEKYNSLWYLPAVLKRYYDSLCYDMVTEKALGCFMNIVVHK